MKPNWNRILSALLAAIYLLAATVGGSPETAWKVALFLPLPLACIWFSDAMGSYLGPTSRGVITRATPGLVVCLGGWLLFLLPIIMVIVSAFAA